ncbi:putative Bromodomain testis-specific protein [Pestalotiopsis sp. NC0098]|nr:putative Bromodomain testis-specific protein [Pestalotiopsis sp. NC0098]
MSVQDMEQAAGFSWLDAHPIFVIILVGPNEKPFGVQKDFLCAKSSYFRRYFIDNPEDKVECVVKLPDASEETFGHAQNFMYTGRLSDTATMPGYDILIDAWKLGNQLDVEGLCDAVLDAMNECRRNTRTIPATPLLIQVWNETPEGSEIRKLLLTWAAEYIRSSESRSEFSKSLPQELLSELVVAMSHLNSAPVIQVGNQESVNGGTQRKNVHYLEDDHEQSEHKAKMSKRTSLDIGSPNELMPKDERKAPRARSSLPNIKLVKSRKSHNKNNVEPTNEDRLIFCADLLNRMLSGPGFWTRLVGPFREPVDPVTDLVPDYLEKISKPMDLGTIKTKMDNNEYATADDFAADVRQIFKNCYTYWDKTAPMWATCEKLEKTFEDKYSGMNKWIAKYDGEEAG